MPPSADPPFASRPQNISLDELAEAFAEVIGGEPHRTESVASDVVEPVADDPSAVETLATEPEEKPAEPDHCPISPRTILEAMLFVGNRDNDALSPTKASELMRDVASEEVPPLVDELNRRYAADGAPYRIVGEGNGYRMTLCEEYRSLRNRFYGHVREARLSQAAIDVLALVAYEQPITAEKLGRLRGKPSSHVLAHLVRRGLLRVERCDPKRRTASYRTTDRFLSLFNLQSLEELPRSEDSPS
ncbi:MAG: SMC-Scp complex subunit ScpB [Planctomycetaceae bacterium]|nr:SMC-Scp complex subunit ScpB [Planctomycetaceae bacterium]